MREGADEARDEDASAWNAMGKCREAEGSEYHVKVGGMRCLLRLSGTC